MVVLSVVHANGQNLPAEPNSIGIIPQPYSLQRLTGQVKVSSNTVVAVDKNNAELKRIAEMFVAEIKEKMKINLRVVDDAKVPAAGSIRFMLSRTPDTLTDEGYKLIAQNGQVVVSGQKGNGVFYGMQTLLQLLPVEKITASYFYLPAVNIIDKPRFEWRGLMLDVGRYYYSMDFLKRYIDLLAMHKLNTFHWHLVEDHGWRLEIKKYPRLTSVGAWRPNNQFDRTQFDKTPKGGYYTQEQAKELVAYAAARYVNIVPEIEMPGHVLSALVAYPELSCTGGPFQMPGQWNIQKDIYCAGNEKTFEFLENVLTEVISIFPSPVIHIGGDEALKDRWKLCPKCQARIKENGLKDEHELQSYFIKRIEKFLSSKGKSIIGWDEILEGGLAPNAAVMSWRGTKGGIEAARQQHNVVMTPNDFFYFDYYQGKQYLEPFAISSGVVTLEKVYSYDPASELTASQAKFIKGVQGNTWSEFIHTPEKAEYMTFPRAAALAEIGWSPVQQRSWNDFTRRMEFQYLRYEQAGINYAKSAYDVWQTTSIDSAKGSALVSFKTNSYKPEIRYTTDGSEPTAKSNLYTNPFSITATRLIKVATFKGQKRVSKISEEAVILP